MVILFLQTSLFMSRRESYSLVMLPKHLSSYLPRFCSQDKASPTHPHTLPTTFSQENPSEYHLEVGREESRLYRTHPSWAYWRPGKAELLRAGLPCCLDSRPQRCASCPLLLVRARALESDSLGFESLLCHLLTVIPEQIIELSEPQCVHL